MAAFSRLNFAESAERKPRVLPWIPWKPVNVAHPESARVQRKPACACGGGCPRCQAAASNPRIGEPDDAYEREADAVAETVLRMPAPEVRASPAGPLLQRQCAACEEDGSDEEKTLRTKAQSPPSSTATEAGAPSAPPAVREALAAPGQPLDLGTRAFFEPRFGRDFGEVRVHTGREAALAAGSVSARAFTLGRDLVFAGGEYDPGSERGRGLLAHELAHFAQQSEGGNLIRRRLDVDPVPPTDPQDPLSTMGPAAFRTLAFSDMGGTVHSLCDLFDVDGSGQVVPATSDACDDSDAVAGGTKPVGCCCLCALTAAGSGPWTIHVTGIGGPRTQPAASGGEFFLHPRSSTFEFGAFNVGGVRAVEDPVLVAGHELCGHGALLERGIHPADAERVDTDVHDPTVKVENLIRAEQGLPGADRALAAGPHRGESFARITLRDYAFNGEAPPAAERPKIQLAKDFIRANNTWVDLFGHSDTVGSPSAKLSVSQARADRMKQELTTGVRPVSDAISKTFSGTGSAGTGTITVGGNRFTKVEGRSDFDAIPGASASDLRRVDIVMPTRPAGAEVPNPGTPTAVNPVGPQSLGTFLRRGLFGHACDRLLVRSAWS